MDLKRQKINVLGVDIDDISQQKAVDAIIKMAKGEISSHYVVTVNAEFVMLARRDPKFRTILNGADLAVADGAWPLWAKLILGGKEHKRVTGTDLVEKLCEKSADLPIRVGFFGGFGNVANSVAKRQKTQYIGLKVVIAEPGDSIIGSDSKLRSRFSQVGRVDILFVAYGMGRQEFLIEKMRKVVDVGVFIGVGGAFDYLSTVKKRAPKWLQDWGFEWAWRLFWQPWRAKRMIRVFPLFWILVLMQYLRQKLLFAKRR